MVQSHAIQSERACCYGLARRTEAGFCPECGRSVVRCVAHSECGGILDDNDCCNICVWPELSLDAGAITDARVGSVLNLSLTLRNNSPVGLPLFVTGVYSRQGRGDWVAEPQSWERLDQHASAPVAIHADALDRAGAHRVEVLILVASRWRWREERFAFTTGLTLSVDEAEKDGGHNIEIKGDSVGPTTVYVSDRRSRERQIASGPREAVVLPLVRADSAEREFRLRGHENGVITPRSTRFTFAGFAEGCAPAGGLMTGEGGLYRVGRDRTERQGGTNHLRLLVEQTSGEVDEESSLMISRHHFDLYIESGRLMLRVQSGNGVKINTTPYRRGSLVELNDGDTIHPIARQTESYAIRLDFDIHNGVTDTVTMTAVQGAIAR